MFVLRITVSCLYAEYTQLQNAVGDWAELIATAFIQSVKCAPAEDILRVAAVQQRELYTITPWILR